MLWPVLDYIFHILHIVVILINCFAWIHPKTRKLHLIAFVSTSISWLGLGIFYGFGYCFLTDWQWQVKHKLGEHDLPDSYITYWLNNILSLSVDPKLVDQVVMWVFICLVFISILVHGKKTHHFVRKR